MMPDITGEETTTEEGKIVRKKQKKEKKEKKLRDPSFYVPVAIAPLQDENYLRALAPKPKESAPESEPQSSDSKAKAKAKDKTENIVNEDVCSSCGGTGNFICCDACPRSFHFTCAEPPLDPLNLPEDDWFCCECRNTSITSTSSTTSDIFTLMLRDAQRINPKCFVMPRRFRYQPKEEDLQKLLSGQLVKSEEIRGSSGSGSVKAVTSVEPTSHIAHPSSSLALPTGPIIINETVKLDHCHSPFSLSIKTPNISSLKASHGYCHCCGLYGLTRSALQKSSEDPSIPCDLRLQRPILSCNICPLYWHLDCLDPPMASFPSNADSGWTCPIHFTSEKCLAFELAESLVQAALLLPEDAVKRQFEQKIKRMQEDRAVDSDEAGGDQEEMLYGISSSSVNVPDLVKELYYKQ